MAEEKRGVMCFTVGSINYSLETESSDRDELHFVLPSSLRDVMLGNICKTTQTIDEKEKVDCLEVDMRNVMQWIKKPNMSNSSFLWAKEVRYTKEFQSFYDELDASVPFILYGNRKNLLYSTLGMLKKSINRIQKEKDAKALVNFYLYALHTQFICQFGERVDIGELKAYFQGNHPLKRDGRLHEMLRQFKRDHTEQAFDELLRKVFELQRALQNELNAMEYEKRDRLDEWMNHLENLLAQAIWQWTKKIQHIS